jgi:hypothetical protein
MGIPKATASQTPVEVSKPVLSEAGGMEPKIKDKRVSISSYLPLTSGGNFAKPKAFTPHPKSGYKAAPSPMTAADDKVSLAPEPSEELATLGSHPVATEGAVLPIWDAAMQLAAALPSHRTTVEEVPESSATAVEEFVSMEMDVDAAMEQATEEFVTRPPESVGTNQQMTTLHPAEGSFDQVGMQNS